MSNEIRITVTGENKASPAIKAVGDDSEHAARKVKNLSEKTDQLDESGSHATSSLGALGSGFELIGKTNVQDKLNQVALATDFMSGIGEGATLVMDKFGGSLSKLKNPAEALKGGLGKLKEGFTDASSTAGKFTTGAIAAGAAVAALVAVNATLNAVLQDKVNVSMHDTIQGLQDMATAGRVSNGDLTGVSSNTKTLADDLDTLNSGLSQTAENFAHTGLFASDKMFGNDIENSRKRIAGLDDALSTMVAGGDLEKAQQSFALLSAEAAKQGVTTEELAKGFPKYTEAVKNTVDPVDGLTSATDASTTALSAQDEALKRVTDSLKAQTDPAFALIQAQEDLADRTNDYSKAVKKNGANSREAKDASLALDKAYISLASASASAAQGSGHLTGEQRKLLSAAGASKGRIDALDKSLNNAWKNANKLAGDYYVDIFEKYHISSSGVNLNAKANDPRLNRFASGGTKGAASGMSGTGSTWVGENGPEILDLPAGSTVRSHGDSMRTMQGAQRGMSDTTVILKFDPSGAPGLVSELFKAMRLEIAAQGGNVQQVLGVVGR